MIRKFKALGAFSVVIAIFVVMASMASADWTSEKYSYTASATSGNAEIDIFNSSVKCTENSFKLERLGGGSIPEPRSAVTLKSTYSKCTAFGLPATVNMTSCDYRVTSLSSPSELSMAIECNVIGDAIDINVYSAAGHTTAICHVRLPEQAGKFGATATNVGGKILISGSAIFLTATQSRTNAVLCPPGTHDSLGTYTLSAGGIILTGSNGAIAVD